jgi:hypothetical protein
MAVEGDGQKFRCNGDIHYARFNAEDDLVGKQNEEPDVWSKVSNMGYWTITSDGTKEFECETTRDMKDRSPFFRKQCFCEIKPRQKPRFCAKEGQNCNKCTGKIVFGLAHAHNETMNQQSLTSLTSFVQAPQPKKRLTID